MHFIEVAVTLITDQINILKSSLYRPMGEGHRHVFQGFKLFKYYRVDSLYENNE